MSAIRRSDLDSAIEAGILSAEQADRLVAHLASAPEERRRFAFVHLIYYLGGMIAIGAMFLFMTKGWDALGGWGGFLISICYAVLALALTHWLLEHRHLYVPAGILATLAVVMVPIAIFFAQMALGYWAGNKPYRDYQSLIDWRWIAMEFGTLAVSTLLLLRYRLPVMLMPIGVTLWCMSIDLVPFLIGQDRVYDWRIRKLISLWFGLAMTLLAFWVDLRSRFSRDYAFWLYLFGVFSFWGALSLMGSRSEWGRLAYCGINVLMILVGGVLGRRVFAVLGGLGIAIYLGHLSWRVFSDSMLFPLAASALGLAIIGLGILWQRHEAAWSARLRSVLPTALRELIEQRTLR